MTGIVVVVAAGLLLLVLFWPDEAETPEQFHVTTQPTEFTFPALLDSQQLQVGSELLIMDAADIVDLKVLEQEEEKSSKNSYTAVVSFLYGRHNPEISAKVKVTYKVIIAGVNKGQLVMHPVSNVTTLSAERIPKQPNE